MRKFVSILLCAVLMLSAVPFAFAEETVDLTITNAEEFLRFAENCRLDSYSQGLTVALDADIDLTGTDFSGIPIFCGSFLGNGHAIFGLAITVSGSQQGLFRYLTQTAIVQDLKVSGTVFPQGSRGNVGGIAGSNAGVIQNCSFTGEISGGDRVGGIAGSNTVSGIIEDCRTDGSISGSHFVGGIAGENCGVIRSCENTASVNTTVQQNSVDISDITIGTITGTESIRTVTDIGGITGTSSGTIRLCRNLGNVGYKHIGYNIGGIAGSQTGFLTDCENQGAVSGRKDVGGIAGHMEPAIKLSYETDMLQILQSQMAVLSDLTDRAVLNAKNNTAAIRALIATLENHVSNAEAAIGVLTIDPENPELKDIDTYTAALQALGSSILGIENTLRSLNQAIQNTGDDLETDLIAITDQVAVIENSLNNGEENLGGSLKDVSDADTQEDLTSKIAASANYGPVLGDANIGGIVGVMAIENDLDPEEDILVTGESSLNLSTEVRSVVLGCTSNGAVTAKKQNAGGIVGWQSLGLVKNCISSGGLGGADYTGGIAGQSLGYIRSSSAKCSITGDQYVGGIAGSGTVVSHCRSMVMLTGTERTGAVLGYAEENHTDIEQPIAGNLYASIDRDPGAIDGISYADAAEPIALDAFLALEDLPDDFKAIAVTFLFEDGTAQVITLQPGTGLDLSQIPELPEKPGFTASWDGLDEIDLSRILFDVSFKAAYTRHGVTIASDQTREDGRPVLLVQGDFSSDSMISMESLERGPQLSEKETLLESWAFSVSHSEVLTAVRCLLPAEADADQLQLYVRTNDGNWNAAQFTVDGSYAVVSLETDIDGIALVQVNAPQIPWLLISGVLAIAMTGVVVVILRKRKSKAPFDQKDSEIVTKD